MAVPSDDSGGEAWHVGRTLRILELLTFTPMSTTQVAEAMHAQPRTVRRVLDRLVRDEFLVAREFGRRRVFEVTMRLPALAGQMVERSSLRPAARPLIELVHERTGATAHLVVPSYRDVLCIVHAGPLEREAQPRLREVVPAMCTAGGKALLAWRHRWRERLLAEPLTRYTARTCVDPVRLQRELERVRVDGWATENGEYRDGVHAVAVPVLTDDAAVAAITASGGGVDVDAVLPAVRSAALQLSAELTKPPNW